MKRPIGDPFVTYRKSFDIKRCPMCPMKSILTSR